MYYSAILCMQDAYKICARILCVYIFVCVKYIYMQDVCLLPARCVQEDKLFNLVCKIPARFCLKILNVQDICIIDLAIARVVQDLVHHARLLHALASPFYLGFTCSPKTA